MLTKTEKQKHTNTHKEIDRNTELAVHSHTDGSMFMSTLLARDMASGTADAHRGTPGYH